MNSVASISSMKSAYLFFLKMWASSNLVSYQMVSSMRHTVFSVYDSVQKEIEQGVRPNLSEGDCLLVDRQSFFLHNARLALWGNVSCAAFREKLRTCGGSCWTAEDQTPAALSSVAHRSWPWCSSPLACCSLLYHSP